MPYTLCSNVLLLLPLALHVVFGDETALIQAKLNIKPLTEKVRDSASLAEKTKFERAVRALTPMSVNGSHGAYKFSEESLQCFYTWKDKLDAVDSTCDSDCGSVASTDPAVTTPGLDVAPQVLAYISLAGQQHVQTVCETGFWKGHSAALWLCSNPNLHVYTFDLEIPQESLKMLSDAYPGRITAFEGDSRETLKAFAADSANPYCDIMVADGGHYEDIPQSDQDNFALIASREPTRQHVFVVDEVYFNAHASASQHVFEEPVYAQTVTATYERAVEAGAFNLAKSQCVSYTGKIFPITGNTTLDATEGGWCELRFAVEYLNVLQ